MELVEVPKDKLSYAHPGGITALVSTTNEEGVNNLAAFGFHAMCSVNPPMIVIGVRESIDTYKNALATNEFVVGIPGKDIVEKAYKCGDNVVDEFTHSGLTPIPSLKVKPPSIEECQSNLECKLVKMIPTGDHILMIGEVITARVKKDVYADDKIGMRTKMDYLVHNTKNVFMTKDGKEIKV